VDVIEAEVSSEGVFEKTEAISVKVGRASNRAKR
jgi:hypothetical protein